VGGVLRRWVVRPGEKRGDAVGKTKKGKGTKWMVVVDGEGVPLASHLDSANKAEVNLLETTLDNIRVRPAERGDPRPQPERLILDRGYDSDPLRERLTGRGIEMICPHRKNRTRPRTQDGRPLRRYKRRWKVERTFAWLGNFRRLVVRYERHLKTYRAFFHLACLLITLRQL
jgi:transposase